MSDGRFGPLSVLRNLLYPPRCLFCGKLIGWEESLCPACRKAVEEAAPAGAGDCFGCRRVCWCADYREGFRSGMEHFKFDGIRAGQKIFGEMLLSALRQSDILGQVQGVTYVPMPRGRQRRRGYNGAELLADYIAKAAGLPLYHGLLRRQGRRTAHATRSRGERIALAETSYLAGTGLPPQGAPLLLVDDILTTGATLTACAQLLRAGGAGEVYGAAALRTPPQGAAKAPKQGT